MDPIEDLPDELLGLAEEVEELSLADELIDDLLPPEFDWRRVVRRYPIPALVVAAVGGYLLGRSKGPALVDALGAAAGEHVAAKVGAFAEEELL